MAKRAPCSLHEAWHSHWAALFPGELEWETVLGRWVKNNLLLFDSQTFHRDALSPEVQIPAWSETLRVAVNRLGAAVTIAGRELPSGPWFADALIEQSPDWMTCHPLRKLVDLGSRKDDTVRHWTIEGGKMVRNVTMRAGDLIRSELCSALRKGSLKATGLSAIDGSAKRKPVTLEQLKMMERLDFRESWITFRKGISAIMQVEIADGPNVPRKKSTDMSFATSDDALVDEMRLSITEKKVSSASQAAKLVEPKAQRRPGATTESVVERLQRRYGSKYSTRPRRH